MSWTDREFLSRVFTMAARLSETLVLLGDEPIGLWRIRDEARERLDALPALPDAKDEEALLRTAGSYAAEIKAQDAPKVTPWASSASGYGRAGPLKDAPPQDVTTCERPHCFGARFGYAKVEHDIIVGLCKPHLQDEAELVALLPGKWEATATLRGIDVSDLTDQANLPSYRLASKRSPRAAFIRARAVWDRVSIAKTFHEVESILRAAGVKLTHYCAND